MARLDYLSREDLPPNKREIYDRISGSRGTVLNLFKALLNSPDATDLVARLGQYIRYESSLNPVSREIAILATAKEMDSEYEWTQHKKVALDLGVSRETLKSIYSGRAPLGMLPKEGVYVQAAKEIVNEGTLSDSTFKALEHLIGSELVVDLVVLVGYYSMIARIINSLGIELEERS